jgi:AcrR family transcriptional regulator
MTITRRPYRRAAERRGEIIAAAQAEFVRASYAGARTRDIAEAAGINQATLFKHFPTKEALFEEAVMAPLLEAMEGVEARLRLYQQAGSAAEMGELAEASTLRHLEDMERLLPLLATALFSDLELGRRLFRTRLAPLIALRGEVLRPLAKEGVDPRFVGLASFGVFFAVAMQRWLGGDDGDLAEVAAQFNRLFTGGFARE